MPAGNKINLLLIFLFLSCQWLAQTTYGFDVSSSPAGCEKGSAALSISGTTQGDNISISWSTGETGVSEISGLKEGEYSVNVSIIHQQDTLTITTNTTVPFSVGNQPCKISVAAYFTPNGDNYNDNLYLANWESFPNFELQVYNKWGQKVHTQKSTYVPWDGKSSGINVPDGTYYYIFFFDAADKNKAQKGDFTILR